MPYEDPCKSATCPSHPDACCTLTHCDEVAASNGVFSTQACEPVFYT